MVVVPDFANTGVFDAVMEGIDAVIHVASVCVGPKPPMISK